MPINTALAAKTWNRYCYARDHGHNDFILKAERCNKFFVGEQWDRRDLEALQAQLRPALTINKIISTIGNVMGEQIYNRSEIGFRPASGADPATADVLTKVFKQISNDNQLDWRRSDMFADGIISSRGFLDVRMDFQTNPQGDVRITNLNPKNVIIDPDAEEYDPDTWNEVTTTKWVTADDIAILYSNADADILRYREQSYFPYGYDSIEATRDRFADILSLPGYAGDAAYEMIAMMRCLRVIERQHRVLDRQDHFIDPQTGAMRPVPPGWDRDRIALVTQKLNWSVVPKLVKRIRWTVVCDNVELHDAWSPYEHFTIVPYFPFFRHGKTVGLVENLVGPQELLNKVSSQELHVVNSSANSGWKIKAGALVNMSLEELEQKGGQSGLVLELADLDGAEKIAPNSTPQGLDRISYKAEEHIKTISGITDSMQGQDREDVAAKAIQQKRAAANTNLAKPLDSLTRTDWMLARAVLSLVQAFYSDERIITIEHAHGGGEAEQVTINQVTPEGQIANDLTIGSYDVAVASVPQRETLEDSQFEQAVSMRKDLGMAIPDAFIIETSRLMNKKDLIKQMSDGANSPQAQAQAALQQQMQQAEVAKLQAETAQKQADAGLKQAKTTETGAKAQKEAATPPDDGSLEAAKLQAEMTLEQQRFEAEMARQAQEFAFQKQLKLEEFALKREEAQQKMALAAQAQADKAVTDRVAAHAAAQRPPSPTQGA